MLAKENHFDYIIIGNGLAGLQLALQLVSEQTFSQKRIGLIDPKSKNLNDKTWSFWETGSGKWETLIYKSWETAHFYSKKTSHTLSLSPYTYKTIRAIDFYNHAFTVLKSHENVYFIKDTVVSTTETSQVVVHGKINTYTASHVFDSRIPKDYKIRITDYTLIQQHFKGLIIETENNYFDPNSFSIMDFRFQYKNSTSFIYMLPFSENKALIEFTFFSSEIVAEKIYDNGIQKYIRDHLKVDSYKITEKESGNIPMTDFPFWEYNTPHITKIGTGGGWVKGSTGYAFKHTEMHVSKIIKNLKNGQSPSLNLYDKKYKFYDKIFLEVLKSNNAKGPWIFERFYGKNSITTMFRFLDETSSLKQDLKIVQSLFSWVFIRALFVVLFRR
ncbi:lycopene cyclase family protein [Bizionia sp. KMM 8389]